MIVSDKYPFLSLLSLTQKRFLFLGLVRREIAFERLNASIFQLEKWCNVLTKEHLCY